MATAARRSPFVTKPTEQLIEAAEGTALQRGIGALDLTALGIGAIIGTGIFVIVGEAIGESGPALVLSFVLAGLTCIFSALSYAELASTLPVSGSAYTYAYATMGELFACSTSWWRLPPWARCPPISWPARTRAIALSEGAGIGWGADIVTFGALVAITSVVLTILYGQTRVAYSMCRDGLMPPRLAAVWEKTRTPVILTLAFAVPIATLAAFVPLKEIAELVNIGTLFAFFVVNIAVIWLRRTKPDMERGFRVPLVPVLPLIGAALCVYLMTKLPGSTWLRFGAWLLLGLVIYAVYGYRNSRMRSGDPAV